MAKVGAQRAAVLTGKSKSTIQRAMKSGKLSYSLDQNNRRVIDVAELERVFGIKKESLNAGGSKPSTSPAPSTDELIEKERLAMQVKMLEQQLETAQESIEDLKSQRDKWEQQASQVLLTTQHTHKQLEDLRAEIKETREKTVARRPQQQANSRKRPQQVRKLTANNENASSRPEQQSSRFLFWKRA